MEPRQRYSHILKLQQMVWSGLFMRNQLKIFLDNGKILIDNSFKLQGEDDKGHLQDSQIAFSQSPDACGET